MTAKLFKKAILKALQRYIIQKNLLHASQFGFYACHSMTLQCMRLMYHRTLSSNNNMPWDIQPGVPYSFILPLIL